MREGVPSFRQTMMQVATRFGFHPHHGGQAPQASRREMLRDSTNPAFQERVRPTHAEIGTVKHTAQKLGTSNDTFFRWKQRLSMDHE